MTANDSRRSEVPRSSNRISIHLHQNVGSGDAQKPSVSRVVQKNIETAAPPSVHKAATTSRQPTNHTSTGRKSNALQEEDLGSGYLQSKRALSPREALAEAQTLDQILESKTQEWVASQSTESKAPSKQPSRTVSKAAPPSLPSKTGSGKTKSESTIRRIAREEVVKYRQVERQVESHPQPYAHGWATQVSEQNQNNKAAPTASRVTSRSEHTWRGTVRTSATHESSAWHPMPANADTESKSQQPSGRKLPEKSTISQGASTDWDWHSETEQAAQKGPRSTKSSTARVGDIARGPGLSQPTDQNLRGFYDNPAPESGHEKGSFSRVSIRRRRSFDTDYTIQPGSSISQRPPIYLVQRTDTRSGASYDLDQVVEDARYMVSASHDDRRYESRSGDGRRSPVQPQHEMSELPRQPAAPPQPIPPPPPPPTRTQKVSHQSENLQSGALGVREKDSRHGVRQWEDRPPSPPSPPPMASRFADDQWTYEEEISPNRIRVIRERLIRSRPTSPERPMPPKAPTGPKVKRYEIVESVRSVPEDRGRTKVRDGDERPKQRLRSILRSPGASQYASHYDGRNPRSESISRRVSFSEAIDVTMLSPPPSSSNLGETTGRERRRASRSSKTRYPRYDGLESSTYEDGDDDERYYYERARRPDPPMSSRSTGVAESESEAADRRRALARALSESPSRERGIHVIDRSRRSDRRSQYSPERGRRSEVIPPLEPLSYPLPGSGPGSDHSDGLGPYAPFISPTSSLASNDGRAPILMSGGLSGFSTVRPPSQRTTDVGEPSDAPSIPPQRVRPPQQEDIPPPPVVNRRVSTVAVSQPTRYGSDTYAGRSRYNEGQETRAASDYYPSRPPRAQRSPSPPPRTRVRSSTVVRDERSGTTRTRNHANDRAPTNSYDDWGPSRTGGRGSRTDDSRYESRYDSQYDSRRNDRRGR
ncbi:hypothetical protein KVT40_005162 [Elsinoe batatas]|uniref:Uncharacterized protein n=1 Tax=Elsinoe batatas TaxID=2601811 RepID=A0A8K0KZ76_9PEZI|nr:hypothetical protein KVT40_005162 [Elsinoe batatas]